jgi:hypothetical protein
LIRHEQGMARRHELVPDAGAGLRDYGAGAAFAAETLHNNLHHLLHHQSDHPDLNELRAQFPAPKKPQS